MNCTKWIYRLSLALSALALLFIIGFERHTRAFSRTTQWKVTARTHSGKWLSTTVYQARVEKHVFLLHVSDGLTTRITEKLPDGDDNPLPLGRWFTVDFACNADARGLAYPDDPVHVFSPNPEHIFPFFSWWYMPPVDGEHGLDILKRYTGEDWHLSYTGDTLVFSNELFSVTMTQKKSDRLPVEVHRSTGDMRR